MQDDNSGTGQPSPKDMASIIGPDTNFDLPKPSNSILADPRSAGEAELFRKLKDRENTAISWVFLIFVWLAGGAFIFVAVSRVLHFALPVDCSNKLFDCMPFHTWLSKEQVQEIDKILFSGAVGGILATFAKGKLGK